MTRAPLSPERQHALDHARSAARLVGLVAPLTLTLIGVVLVAIWVPRLPDPIAIHWGMGGEADGFGSPWTVLTTFPLISMVLTSMYFLHRVLAWQAALKPAAPVWGPMHRLLPAIVLASVVLVFVIEIGTTMMQLDLADARDAGSVTPVLGVGCAVALGVGALAYAAQPKLRIDAETAPVDSEELGLAPTERAVWFGTTRASVALLASMFAVVALLGVGCVLVFSTRPIEWVAAWIMVSVTACVVGLTLTCTWFSVRVDERGLEARSVLGWPVIRVAAAEVARVDVAHVAPFAEFGGWGLRWVPGGSMGIVMRTGDGIRVTRTNGTALVITLDDARTAAAVLSASAGRAETGKADHGT